MVGHGNIIPDDVMLIGIVQVSEGSWMPIPPIDVTSRHIDVSLILIQRLFVFPS